MSSGSQYSEGEEENERNECIGEEEGTNKEDNNVGEEQREDNKILEKSEYECWKDENVLRNRAILESSLEAKQDL